MDQVKLWKTAFKEFDVIWSAYTDHITSNFSTTFTCSILEYLGPLILNLKLFPSYSRSHVNFRLRQSNSRGLTRSNIYDGAFFAKTVNDYILLTGF